MDAGLDLHPVGEWGQHSLPPLDLEVDQVVVLDDLN